MEELAPLPPELSVPLKLREMQVVPVDGRRSAVFKFSRLPDGVEYRTQDDPPRLVLEVKGPTGSEGETTTLPGRDTLISQVHLTPRYGGLELVLEFQGDRVPEYEVRQMADWVVVTLTPAGSG